MSSTLRSSMMELQAFLMKMYGASIVRIQLFLFFLFVKLQYLFCNLYISICVNYYVCIHNFLHVYFFIGIVWCWLCQDSTKGSYGDGGERGRSWRLVWWRCWQNCLLLSGFRLKKLSSWMQKICSRYVTLCKKYMPQLFLSLNQRLMHGWWRTEERLWTVWLFGLAQSTSFTHA